MGLERKNEDKTSDSKKPDETNNLEPKFILNERIDLSEYKKKGYSRIYVKPLQKSHAQLKSMLA